MATAGDIVAMAFREGNLVAAGESASADETPEGLALLNNILAAVPGYNAGTELREVNIGGEYDQSACLSEFIPNSVRLVLDLDAAKTLKLHPQPYEGMRLAVADAGNNLATFNLTLDPNGRRIESAATLVLSTNGLTRQWMYRADLGNWVKLVGLEEADPMPFPQEFDDYFAILLWARLAPRNGLTLDQASAALLAEREAQMQARYRKPRPTQDWGSLGLLSQRRGAFGSSSGFTYGRGW